MKWTSTAPRSNGGTLIQTSGQHQEYSPTQVRQNSRKRSLCILFPIPRQLTNDDEYYDKTPQWQIDKTWDCYPRWDDRYKDTAPGYGLVYNRIGRPNVKGSDEGIEIEMFGKKLRTSNESPNYKS